MGLMSVMLDAAASIVTPPMEEKEMRYPAEVPEKVQKVV
jgi:hypothetical protein